MPGVPAIVTCTGRLTPFDPGALMAMAAWKLPAWSPAGFTVTIRVLGRGPELGVTLSQFPPLLVTGEAVNEVMLELLLDTWTLCVAGTVLLAAKLKLSEFGLVEIGLIPPEELGLNTTGIERNPPADEMLRYPTSVAVGAAEPIATDSVAGVTPLEGLTCNQLVSEKADTVKFTGPPVDVSCSGCEGPDAPLKRSCGG